MGGCQGLVLQVLGSKLEVDEDLAGTSRVLPLRPSASVWDVLACGQACGRERHISGGGAHTQIQSKKHTYSRLSKLCTVLVHAWHMGLAADWMTESNEKWS